jgi:hypothetical protein
MVWKTIIAIVKFEQLAIKFPSTKQECKLAASGFQSISTNRAIKNQCVGVVDGLTGDAEAIQQCGLLDLINNLPLGKVVIGDAAYTPSEHDLVPMYYGVDKT